MEQPIVLEVTELTKTYNQSKYALHNISFTLQKGEALGVIGKNGSGKSTLLKVLSQITRPTSGKATFYERPISMIEIGAGFHPDLSGKDNIYLNGSLLGLTKKEIAKHYDDIVNFSELHEAIFEPLKTYSSGMYLRLAFSVAFHLGSNILLIDEVLSVGDWSFTQKCYKKIKELLATNTLSMILVSHNLQEINALCNRCLLLQKGKIIKAGKPHDVIETYISQIMAATNFPKYIEHENFILSDFSVETPAHKSTDIFTDTPFFIRFRCYKKSSDSSLQFMVNIYEITGYRIFCDSDAIHEEKFAQALSNLPAGTFEIKCYMPANLFNHGLFSYNLIISENYQLSTETPILGIFRIQVAKWEKDKPWTQLNVSLRPKLQWSIEQIAS